MHHRVRSPASASTFKEVETDEQGGLTWSTLLVEVHGVLVVAQTGEAQRSAK
jgi:hypothetical protein